MNFTNCRMCGRAIQTDGQFETCSFCRQKEIDEFNKVKDYLYKYPNSNAAEVSEATGVPMKIIQKYLREDRIIAINNTNANFLGCEKCGKPIDSGKFCKECERANSNEFLVRKSNKEFGRSRRR